MDPLFRNDKQGQFPTSWYAATASIPPPRPALEETRKADVAILGAGFTGLTCALELARKGIDVVVLEAHRAGFGASGRNGGQVGSGFNMDQRKLEAQLGREVSGALWDLTMEAKAMVRDFCASHAPEARFTPGVARGVWKARDMADLSEEAEHLERRHGFKTQVLDGPSFRDVVRSPV